MQAERIKKYLILAGIVLSAFIFSRLVSAQPRLENITFKQDEQDFIRISYDLIAPDSPNAKYYVSLRVSSNGGKDFSISPSMLKGDAGSDVTPGAGKQAIWEAGREFKNLKGEEFVFQITADDANLPPREYYSQKDDSSMVLIPAGTFLMGGPANTGDADEHPQVNVFVGNYYIDRFPVTVSQFRQYCQDTGADMPKQPGWSTSKHPVVNVTWEDADNYAQWAGKRLPTEAEWEKAARGKSNSKYCFGDDPDELKVYAWFNSESAHPVGKKKPNRYDLFDMHGNVWQWCSDWYDENQYQNLSDLKNIENPKGPSDGKSRVLRGGSWTNDAESCRVSNRSWDLPSNKGINRGFRCAKDVK